MRDKKHISHTRFIYNYLLEYYLKIYVNKIIYIEYFNLTFSCAVDQTDLLLVLMLLNCLSGSVETNKICQEGIYRNQKNIPYTSCIYLYPRFTLPLFVVVPCERCRNRHIHCFGGKYNFCYFKIYDT